MSSAVSPRIHTHMGLTFLYSIRAIIYKILKLLVSWRILFSFFLTFLLVFYHSCPNISPFALLRPSQHLPLPCSHNQFSHCCPCPWVIHTCSLSSPFPFFPPFSPSILPPGHCQSVPCFHAYGSISFVSLFWSLDSSCRWDHMVFAFYHLAYFT